MNSVAISGRVLKGGTVKEVDTAKGKTKLAKFTVAVPGTKGALVSCTAWGKSAEFFEKWFAEGSTVEVKGAWQTNKYEKDGRTIWDNFVLVEEFGFPPKPKDAPKQNTEAGSESFMQMPDDFSSELPFV